MIQFSEQGDCSASEQPSTVFSKRQQLSPPWLILVGGSVVLHLLLIRWVGATIQPSLTPTAAVPVELIELSDQLSQVDQAAASDPQGANQAQLPTANTKSPALATAISQTPSQPTGQLASQLASQTIALAEAQTAAPSLGQPNSAPEKLPPLARPARRQFKTVIPSAVAASRAPTGSFRLPQAALSAPESPPPHQVPRLSPTAEASPSVLPAPVLPAPDLPEQILPTQPEPIRPSPVPTLASQVIALPVPNLSQPQPSEQPELTAIAARLVPSYLMANLTASVMPSDGQFLQPRVEVQRFLTNSQLPPCAVTPEAVYFLGKTVALRVTTNAAGRVIQTFTAESSQNLAYDELATCLVRNWDFKPALAQSDPVAQEGLSVRITIDRS